MSAIAINVENISKQYKIGELQNRHNSLREQMTQSLKSAFRMKGSPSSTKNNDIYWALKDITFDVKEGEVVGIIGHNGAGKSTLLKILTQITAPTSGHARIHGRVSSLLEVGTGFHPDLTGRENIFLNGAILGMPKEEIKRKFDEIVSFAEVEEFIDTPVKRYSSGMGVRLAFSVAAHLEPEILLIDEVLAVGDTDFQKKCMGKMGNVAKEGRTILFVSHNMAAVSLLCPVSILLKKGRIESYGRTEQVLREYLAGAKNKGAEASWSFDEAPGSEYLKLRSVRVLNEQHEINCDMWMNEDITLEAEFWMLRQSTIEVSFHVYNQQGALIFATGNFNDMKWRTAKNAPGLYSCSCIIPKHFLNDGMHYVKVYLQRGDRVDVELNEIISFNMIDPGDARGDWTGEWIGLVRPILPWSGERIGNLP